VVRSFVDRTAALDCLTAVRAEVAQAQDHPVVQVKAGSAGSAARVKLKLAVGVRARQSPPPLFPIAPRGLQTIHKLVDRFFGNTL
jgi:hypothetical protein